MWKIEYDNPNPAANSLIPIWIGSANIIGTTINNDTNSITSPFLVFSELIEFDSNITLYYYRKIN